MPDSTVLDLNSAVDTGSSKMLLTWKSPERVFIPKDEKYIRTIMLTLLVIGVILIFFQQFLLYAVFLALAFVSYVLRTVQPQSIEHRISDYGVTTGGRNYLWNELTDFWFTERDKFLVLNINTKLRFPPRLFILVAKGSSVSREQLIEAISPHIPFRELPSENSVDKIFGALSQKFNLS